MALISERKEGRPDGAYTRVFGDEALGALISQVHANSIAAGTELEKIITKHAAVMDANGLGRLLNNNLATGVYLMPKKLLKKHLKPLIETLAEPDFVVVKVVDEKIFVVELKDGDSFDTKKSAGEVSALRGFASKLHGYLLKSGVTAKADTPYTVEIRFCCFNQPDKEKIVVGCKSKISKAEAMTGEEFCKLIGISWSTIVSIREVDQQKNLRYFIETLAAIPTINRELRKIILPDATPAS